MELRQNNTHVAIVGGGITGLAAAWYLQKIGIPYTVLEASARWGGKIYTETVHIEGVDEPFIVEAGPDSFIAQKPWAAQLARDLGLGSDLLGTNDDKRKIFVLNKGKLTPLPDGLLLIVPTRFMPFALSPLISIPGKLRMGMEMFVPAKHDDEDETLAAFMRRRLGEEALVKLGEPLMSGIYNTDPEHQSLLATFPRFRKLEQDYGSITRGMLASRRKAASHAPPNGKKSSMFLSMRDGMGALISGLVERLEGDLRLSTPVSGITQTESGYTLDLDGETLNASHLIMATPSPVTANLLADIAPNAVNTLNNLSYVSTGTLSFAFHADDLRKVPDSFGVVIPRSENRAINAVTYSSTKFNHRAPQGYKLVRVFFGGSRSPQTLAMQDDNIITTARAELKDIYGITAEPVFTRLYRWSEATPQYDLDHLKQIDELEATLPTNIRVAGSAFRGIGVPDCVHQAQMAVDALFVDEAEPVNA